jgi:hypothetical protein
VTRHRGPTDKPPRVAARPGVDARVRADPYRLLAAAQDRRSLQARRTTTDDVLVQVQDACEDALTLSGGSLVLVVLGSSVAVPPGLAPLLVRLRDVCALVVLLTGEQAEGPRPAVRTTVLEEGDPLRQDAAVVLLSPERALALHARQDRDGGWTCRRTADPHEVGESARMLLTRAASVEREQVLALG